MSSALGMTGVAQMGKPWNEHSLGFLLISSLIADYCGSKSAVISLHESLRYELDKRWGYYPVYHRYYLSSIILRYRCPNIRTSLVCPGHVYTPMFRTVVLPTFPFFAFFCPSVQPVTVVKKIITALDDQHSQIILLPFYTNFIPYIGHLPSFLRDLVQWVSIRVLLA